MKNAEIYEISPRGRKLENQGVTDVNSLNEGVLRYELETFVCEGQYAEGIHKILETFLANIAKPEQPCAWVSGFYGSGKSHLVKMLSALWKNTPLSDDKLPRDIVNLPKEIKILFKELDTKGRQNGGLLSAIGTLSSEGTESVNMIIMRIIFRAVGLPADYSTAKFVLWLRKNKIEEQVGQFIRANGKNGETLEEELKDFRVSPLIAEALKDTLPESFKPNTDMVNYMSAQYPPVQDISTEDLASTIKEALSKDGKMPLTLLVLDEAQQFIGNDANKTVKIQDAVETCSKLMDGRVLVVATGQSGITDTPNLKKLEGRFNVRIQLSDNDIEAVIRKVILKKKPSASAAVSKVREQNLGEITRHLAGTALAYRNEDTDSFVADYPTLATRRRFWEETLRKLDQSGTESQLRNQLAMTLKITQDTADLDLGNVAPADVLYFDLADRLVQNALLPRDTNTLIQKDYESGDEDKRLTARAAGLIFLINKLDVQGNQIGIKATADTLADLMVTDLNTGSSDLRQRLPKLLDNCNYLMKTGDSYQIQTNESRDWHDAFNNQRSGMKQNTTLSETRRENRIEARFNEVYGKRKNYQHGTTRTPRNIIFTFRERHSKDDKSGITVWIQNGWKTTESDLQNEARKAGQNASTIFVFIPKSSANEIYEQIINESAAEMTLSQKGEPQTPEGREAKNAILSKQHEASGKLKSLIEDVIDAAVVFQGGGSEVSGSGLAEKLDSAIDVAVKRLYPDFDDADNPKWGKVYEKAHTGATDALERIGHKGPASDHPVCKQILGFITPIKTGDQIRKNFEASPYGWTKDAIEGSILALMAEGTLRAETTAGKPVSCKELERKNIASTRFIPETITINAKDNIEIRKLFQSVDISANSENALEKSDDFTAKLKELANAAGGDPPCPHVPETKNTISVLEGLSGNERLAKIVAIKDILKSAIESWKETGEKIEKRMPEWEDLEALEEYIAAVPAISNVKVEIDAIRDQRLLLDDPDPISPLVTELVKAYSAKYAELKVSFENLKKAGETDLANDSNWAKLSSEKQDEIRSQTGLTADSLDISLETGNAEQLIDTLRKLPFSQLEDKINALPGRYEKAHMLAAKETEPKTQYSPKLPKGRLETESDVDEWLKKTGDYLKEMLKNGPVEF